MRRSRFRTSCLASSRSAADQAARWIVGVNRADQEGRRAAADNRERRPVHLPIQRKPYQLHGMGERVELTDIVEHRAALQDTPQRIERRGSKKHRKDDKV